MLPPIAHTKIHARHEPQEKHTKKPPEKRHTQHACAAPCVEDAPYRQPCVLGKGGYEMRSSLHLAPGCDRGPRVVVEALVVIAVESHRRLTLARLVQPSSVALPRSKIRAAGSGCPERGVTNPSTAAPVVYYQTVCVTKPSSANSRSESIGFSRQASTPGLHSTTSGSSRSRSRRGQPAPG